MELLQDLHRAGATICMVTHDPRFAKHADRTIHLFDGRVVEEEKGEERAALGRGAQGERIPGELGKRFDRIEVQR